MEGPAQDPDVFVVAYESKAFEKEKDRGVEG
jgi:hypothetical protein